MSRKKTLEDFIQKSTKVHGDRYDYSKVEYINSKTDVCITCKTHGDFWMKPYNHYKGLGCSKCSGIHPLTTHDFIAKSKEVHGEKYDYSKVEYKNNSTKVCIICKEHGEFWQTPNNHLHGKGCPKCCGKNLTNQEKINKAKVIHNNKYNYSQSDFTNVRIKTIIICPVHGEFEMDFNHHVNSKNGCPMCSRNKQLTCEDFEERANVIHNNKYAYLHDYTTMHNKVSVICPIHGEFRQFAYAHVSGKGCPKCASYTSLEKDIEALLKRHNINYVVQAKFEWLGLLSLDFYLPQYNVAIECQGKQHFGLGGWSKGYDFITQNERDKRKYNLCLEHGIKLLYYSNMKPKEKYFSEVFTNKNKLIKNIKLD